MNKINIIGKKPRWTQKDVWKLILEYFNKLKKNKIKFKYHVEIEEAFRLIERDNDFVIPIEWKWKLRSRLDNYLSGGLIK